MNLDKQIEKLNSYYPMFAYEVTLDQDIRRDLIREITKHIKRLEEAKLLGDLQDEGI